MRTHELNRLWEQLTARHPETLNWSQSKMQEELSKLKQSIEEGRGKVVLSLRQKRPTLRRQMLTVNNATIAPQDINPELRLEVHEPSSSNRKAESQLQLQLISDDSNDALSVVKYKTTTNQASGPVNLVSKKKNLGRRENLNSFLNCGKRRNKRIANSPQRVNPLKKFRYTLEYNPQQKIIMLLSGTDDKMLKAHASDQRPIDLTNKFPRSVINEDKSKNGDISAIDLTFDKCESTRTLVDEIDMESILCDGDPLILSIQHDVNMPSLGNECNSDFVNNGSVNELDKSRSPSSFKTILNCFNDSISELSDPLNFPYFQFENVYNNDACNDLSKDIEMFSQEMNVIEEIENIAQDVENQSKYVSKDFGEPALGLSYFKQQSNFVETEKIFKEANVETNIEFESHVDIDSHSKEQPEKRSLVKTDQTIQKNTSFTKEDESKRDLSCSEHCIDSIEDNAPTVTALNDEVQNKNLDVNISEDQLIFDELITGDGKELPFSEVSTLAFSNREVLSNLSGEFSSSVTQSIEKSDSNDKSSRNPEDNLFHLSIFKETKKDSDISINTVQATIAKPKETETTPSLEKTEQETTSNNEAFAPNFDEVLDYEPDEENNDVLSVATSWDGSEELTTPVKDSMEDGESLKESLPQPRHELSTKSNDAALYPNQSENIECASFKIPKFKETEESPNTESTQKAKLHGNSANPFSSQTNDPTLGRNRCTRNSLGKESATFTPSAGVLPTRPPLSRRNLTVCPAQPTPTLFGQPTLNNNQPPAQIMGFHSQSLFGRGQQLDVVYQRPNSTVTSSSQFSCIPKPSINDSCVQLFGVVCYSHLDGRCNALQCGLSHELHNIGEVQNKLIRLNETNLKHAYVFVFRNKLLFKKFFPSFAIVFSNRRKTDLLLKMVADCIRYPDCSSSFLKILYESLLQCGFNRAEACKQIMDRCLNRVMKRWPNQLNALVPIIMTAGWANNLHYIAEICACKEFKFPVQAMSTILDNVLQENDQNLANHVVRIIATISLDHLAEHMDKVMLLLMKLKKDYNTNSSTQHDE